MTWIRGGGNSALFIHFSIRAICGLANHQLYLLNQIHTSMVSYQKGPTRHAYAWQIGPFWQNTLDMTGGTAGKLWWHLVHFENFEEWRKFLNSSKGLSDPHHWTDSHYQSPLRKNRALFQYKYLLFRFRDSIIRIRQSWDCHLLCCWLPELTIPLYALLRGIIRGASPQLGQRTILNLEVSEANPFKGLTWLGAVSSSRENGEFVFIIIVQFMMSANIQIRFGLQIGLVCL